MKKVKVAFLISTLNAGGAERQLITTVNGMNLNQYDVKIFVFRPPLTLRDQIKDGISVEVCNITSYFNLLLIFKSLNKINEYKPQILHSSMYASNLLARIYKILFDKTCIIINHIHGLGTWIKNHHIFLDRLLLKGVDKILVVSNSSYNLRVKRERYPLQKLEILYNSINTDYYSSCFYKQNEIDNNYFILGSACRIVELKQIDKIIDIIKEIKNNGIKIRYFIAGNGSEKEKLVKYVIDNDLDNEVQFLGHLDSMKEFYSLIDVLIMNSKTEDMPLSIIEAFASGNYCIAPDIGGVGELLKGNEGLLFNKDSTKKELVDEIIEFLKTNNIKIRSNKNRMFAITHFDDKIYQQKLVKIYSNLLEKRY